MPVKYERRAHLLGSSDQLFSALFNAVQVTVRGENFNAFDLDDFLRSRLAAYVIAVSVNLKRLVLKGVRVIDEVVVKISEMK